MNIFKIILMIIGLIIVVGSGFIWLNSRPLSKVQVSAEIHKLLLKEVEKKETVTQGLMLIESGENNFRASFASGDIEQPFHVASIGKAFTATLIGLLVDEGKLNFNDLIIDYLDSDLLLNLFEYDGVDYRELVTISHLLSHTSGIADYFEDTAKGSMSMTELVLSETDHFWTPDELVNFSGKYQSSVGIPGETYHYSDTGYILLGLIIERVTGNAFHEELHEKIFDPLDMDDSYLAFYSDPKNGKSPIADIWFNGIEISEYKSLSIDWAGGGIISTLDDLAIFVRELNSHTLVSEDVLNEMYKFDNKFTTGIYYGLGFMEYHFTDYFPTLSFLPVLRGHMGVLGTQMLYEAESDTVFICSFGSTDYASDSVKTMIKALSYTYRIKK